MLTFPSSVHHLSLLRITVWCIFFHMFLLNLKYCIQICSILYFLPSPRSIPNFGVLSGSFFCKEDVAILRNLFIREINSFILLWLLVCFTFFLLCDFYNSVYYALFFCIFLCLLCCSSHFCSDFFFFSFMVWKLISTVSLAIDMQIVGSKLFFLTVSCLFSSSLMFLHFIFQGWFLYFLSLRLFPFWGTLFWNNLRLIEI